MTVVDRAALEDEARPLTHAAPPPEAPQAPPTTRPDAPRLSAATLRVTEIFYSLQGETSRVGLPTVFVRLTGCPLRCGYCDTAYAFHGGTTMTLEHILAEVGRHQTRY